MFWFYFSRYTNQKMERRVCSSDFKCKAPLLSELTPNVGFHIWLCQMRPWLKEEHLEKTFIDFTYLQHNISTNREKKFTSILYK